MRMIRRWRGLCVIAFFTATLAPARAQDSLSPSKTVCGFINFGFCDQGARQSASPPPDATQDLLPPPTDKTAQAPSPKIHKKARLKKTRIRKTKPVVAPQAAN